MTYLIIDDKEVLLLFHPFCVMSFDTIKNKQNRPTLLLQIDILKTQIDNCL
jgi:hypothetical protein